MVKMQHRLLAGLLIVLCALALSANAQTGQYEAGKHYTVIQQPVPTKAQTCLLYTSPSPRDLSTSRMPSSA